ncbi:alpha/beta fold hydrolase [Microlunatus parietis]|uniref:Pimeloyl-ACP methyl ester carboxylesterase n=1 Tax=Microlunatus parietis TaxID=682979 RepID=A0A7Y9LGB7_9ACTN|nr:alpha/beta hydrolase [Microlunatus parietis]NYE75001.1 pimeloyl-ACP methyl ester carboxylesterase [Microlunatus parietis]
MTDDGLVVAGDLRLFVSRTGVPDGPPVILLHGLGGDHTTWDRFAEHLGDRYQVLAVDQRGHGGSDHADGYSFRALAEDVWLLADALDLDRVTLIGHSMGGLAALIAAQLRPDRVAALVVEEAPPPVPLDRPDVEPPDQPTPYDFALINQLRAELRSPDPANWSGLESITAPVLILAGGPDSTLPQEAQAEVAGRIPGASFRTLPYGHGIHAGEGFSAFCDAIDEFLGSRVHAARS